MFSTRSITDLAPGYLRLHKSGELERRVSEAVAGLKSCRVCPWNCEIDRLAAGLSRFDERWQSPLLSLRG